MQVCTEKKSSSLLEQTLDGKVLIIAGETSGDQHGADLVNELKAKHPKLQFFAMGSKNLEEAGAEIILDSRELAVVGFIEIFKIFNKIRNAFKVIKQFIKTQKPKLVILIDYPGFNLRIVKFAKKNNCKVLYYISPQLWAWREGRIKTIKKSVDQMAVIFPFEVDFYQKHGVKAYYVGNPLTHQLPLSLTREQARNQLNIDQNQTIIGLLPGSREAEIRRMLPIQIDAVKLLLDNDPSLTFLLPLADSLCEADLSPYLDASLPIKIVKNYRFAAIKSCNTVIATSGTVTLETALLGVPQVIAYKGSPISYYIAKKLVKIDHIGLCNIVANKTIAKEFIQKDATPENLCAETLKILRDHDYSQQIKENTSMIKAVLTQSTGETSLTQCIESTLFS